MIPTNLYTALKILADRNNRNVSNQIRQCIFETLEREGIEIKSERQVVDKDRVSK